MDSNEVGADISGFCHCEGAPSDIAGLGLAGSERETDPSVYFPLKRDPLQPELRDTLYWC